MQRITNELINTPVKRLAFLIAFDSYANPQNKQDIYDNLKIEGIQNIFNRADISAGIKNLNSQDKEQCKKYLQFLAKEQENIKLNEYILEIGIQAQIHPHHLMTDNNDPALHNQDSVLNKAFERELLARELLANDE